MFCIQKEKKENQKVQKRKQKKENKKKEKKEKQKSYYSWVFFDASLILTYTYGDKEMEIAVLWNCYNINMSKEEYNTYVRNGKIDMINFLNRKISPMSEKDFLHLYSVSQKLYKYKFSDKYGTKKSYIYALNNKDYSTITMDDCVLAAHILNSTKFFNNITGEKLEIIHD